jgi:hypothetical protein
MDWNERSGQLRQQVGDLYDPALTTPDDWVAWFVAYNRDEGGEHYTADEHHALLRYATEAYERFQEAHA